MNQSIQQRIANLRQNSPTPPPAYQSRPKTKPINKPMVQNTKKWDMKEAAIQLNIGFKELFNILRESGYFTKVGKNNLPIASLIEKKYFYNELKKFKRGHVENQYTKTYVLPDGMSFLSELVKDHKQKDKNHETSSQI